MSVVAVLGAGAGGAAAVAELTTAGHEVRLWSRNPATLRPFAATGGVGYEGVLGAGLAVPAMITADLAAAVRGVEVILVCLPAVAHGGVAAALAAEQVRAPVVLNPGHTCGALHVAATFARAGVQAPPLAELSTLTYVARKPTPDRVRVTGVAGRVHAACLPGGESALEASRVIYPRGVAAPDVLATGLANVNLVLHPPGAVLSAAWVEATGGAFSFYADATTPAVARTIAVLDAERLAVAAAFGHELDPLLAEMEAIGTVSSGSSAHGDLRAAIAEGEANSAIPAPDSLRHRYYIEDFGYGVMPFVMLARIAGVAVPVAEALLRVADTFIAGGVTATGLTAERLGVAGLDAPGMMRRVREDAPLTVGRS